MRRLCRPARGWPLSSLVASCLSVASFVSFLSSSLPPASLPRHICGLFSSKTLLYLQDVERFGLGPLDKGRVVDALGGGDGRGRTACCGMRQHGAPGVWRRIAPASVCVTRSHGEQACGGCRLFWPVIARIMAFVCFAARHGANYTLRACRRAAVCALSRVCLDGAVFLCLRISGYHLYSLTLL